MADAPITVIFADISGSTMLCAVRGDETAYKLVSTCLTILEAEVQRFGGRVIKRVGDAILAVFDSAEPAVHAAQSMQIALEAPGSEVHAEGVRVRVGIATGTAVLDAGAGAQDLHRDHPGGVGQHLPQLVELNVSMHVSIVVACIHIVQVLLVVHLRSC